MVNDIFLLYDANVLAGSGSLPAKSHSIVDIGAVGEVHPLEAWTRHQRSSRSIGEAAAATEEHRLEASAGRQRSRRG